MVIILNDMKLNTNKKLKPPAPIPEFQRQCDVIDGVEVISYTPVVYPQFPSADEFSLEAMMKAGVSPESLKINTQNIERLDGVDMLSQFAAEAESILTPSNVLE